MTHMGHNGVAVFRRVEPCAGIPSFPTLTSVEVIEDVFVTETLDTHLSVESIANNKTLSALLWPDDERSCLLTMHPRGIRVQ